MSKSYDLVIIGGGSAGLSAASFAVQFGARVALVDKDRIGGDCTWTGCVPSKTLLKVAKVAHTMRTAGRYGLSAVEPAVHLKVVLDHVRGVVDGVYHEESPEALRADGIDVYLGGARFLDPHTLLAGGTTLAARNVLIATGAHPFIPPIQGLEGVDYITYEDIWQLETLPRQLLIVGAGPVGSEMAQAFQRLGSQVTLIASRDRLLPRDEPAASNVLAEVFKAEGIQVVYNARAELVWRDADGGIHVGAGGHGLAGDALLIATGRRPNVEGLDLEKGGVTYSAEGIQVDEHLRTSQRHIYAAGDCTGGYQFTHYAGWQAAMAVRNALLPGLSKGVTDLVPWTTFTDPEVAHVGLTEEQALERFSDEVVRTCDWPMAQVDRARAEGDTAGFLKLVHKKDGTLLGATIVARRAGEMIHEWIVALEHGIKVGDLSNAIHVYPTYSIAGMQAAAKIRVNQLLDGLTGRVVHGLARLMR
jgi:pyruvate/2-oxoglutarate dehydrogenase complex dihydrolipoamide dehydrogenase (E3) component